IRVWDVATGQVEHTLEGHSDWVRSVVFSPDGGKLASGSGDRTVRVQAIALCGCGMSRQGRSSTRLRAIQTGSAASSSHLTGASWPQDQTIALYGCRR